MGKSCFDGYLTKGCKTCEYWKNTSTQCGCATPFPISHCEYFHEMEKEVMRYEERMLEQELYGQEKDE